jgi:hypothetical protein
MSAAATAMSAHTAHFGIDGLSLLVGEVPFFCDLPDMPFRN